MRVFACSRFMLAVGLPAFFAFAVVPFLVPLCRPKSRYYIIDLFYFMYTGWLRSFPSITNMELGITFVLLHRLLVVHAK